MVTTTPDRLRSKHREKFQTPDGSGEVAMADHLSPVVVAGRVRSSFASYTTSSSEKFFAKLYAAETHEATLKNTRCRRAQSACCSLRLGPAAKGDEGASQLLHIKCGELA